MPRPEGKPRGSWGNGVAGGLLLRHLVVAGVLLFSSLLDCVSTTVHLSHHKVTKDLGENFMATCTDDTGKPVSWVGPKGPLGIKTHPGVEVSSFGTSLVFMPITKDDGGNYSCRGSAQNVAYFHLNVQVPLTFMDTPTVQVGREHTDVTLRCEVKGGDKPVVTWTSEGQDLPPPKYEQIGDGLLIRNVSRADGKTYTCRAMQLSTGNVRDQKITFKVEHKPVLRHPHMWNKIDEAWGFVGGYVNLTCEVDANPPPKFEWYRKNHKVTFKDRAIYEPHKSTLQLYINNTLVFGDYKCRATNALGQLEKFITLRQGEQPEPPDLVRLLGTRTRSLDLAISGPDTSNRTVALGMEPIGFRVQYRPNQDVDVDWEHADTVDFLNRKDDVYTVDDLQRDTEYELRVATRNRAGLSEYSGVTVFRTAKSWATALHQKTSYCLQLMSCFLAVRAML